MLERKFTVVLFDLDGTLADSLPMMRTVYLDFLQSHGCIGSKQEFDELNGKTLMEIAETLKNRYRLSGDREALQAEFASAITQSYPTETVPTPGARALLIDLVAAGYRLGIVTSAPAQLVSSFLVRHDLAGYFERVVAGDGKRGKPCPDLYLDALALFGVGREEVLAVEDSDNGVRAATSAGLEVARLGGGTGNGSEIGVGNLSELGLLLVTGS